MRCGVMVVLVGMNLGELALTLGKTSFRRKARTQAGNERVPRPLSLRRERPRGLPDKIAPRGGVSGQETRAGGVPGPRRVRRARSDTQPFSYGRGGYEMAMLMGL